MILKEITPVFKEKLSALYNQNEIHFIWKLACQYILNIDFSTLLVNENLEINPDEVKAFQKVISELEKGTPSAYVFGKTHFYGNEFYINENALIPRPETEELVELCLNELKKNGITSAKIIDVGTGSGCIAVSLAKSNANYQVTACDVSEKALELAKKNAELHECKMEVLHCDYLEHQLGEIYDVFISNPPYIGVEEWDEIDTSVKNHEPNLALFAPKNSVLAFYEKIANDIKKQAHHSTFVFVEINQKLGQETWAIFKEVLSEAYLLKDLSGNDRFVWGRIG